jgi:hypothetical protein
LKRKSRFRKGDLVKHRILAESIGVVRLVEDDGDSWIIQIKWISWIAKPPETCEPDELIKIYHRDV